MPFASVETNTPSLHYSNKMVSSVFETFWPVLQFFQILGLFPIKKSSENRCGFQGISSRKYLILTIGVQVLGLVCAILAMSYITIKQDMNFLHLWKELFAVTESTLGTIHKLRKHVFGTFFHSSIHLLSISKIFE